MQSPNVSFANSTQIFSSPIQHQMPTSPILLQNPSINSNSPVQKSFSYESECKKICLNRFKYVLFITATMQYLLFMIFSIPLNLKYLHPIEWFKEFFVILISPLTIISVIHGISCLNLLLKEKIYYPTRISRFIKSFTYEVLMTLLNFLIGLFTARMFVRYLDDYYKSPTIKNEDKIVLNECYSFLLFCGVFMRLYYHFKYRDHDFEELTFPTVNQSKFSQIKQEFFTSIKSSFAKSLMPTFHFIGFYIFFGSGFSYFLRKIYMLNASNASFWSTFAILFNIRLLFYSYILAAFILSNIKIMKKIVNMFATQPHQFSIAGTNTLILSKALELNKIKITLHLAAQDLFLLADNANDSRRKEFYSLSIPGGHPHNWKQLVQQILILIDTFSSDLKANIEYVAKNRNNNTSPNNLNIAMSRFYEQKRMIRETNEINGIRSFVTSPLKVTNEPTVEKRSQFLMNVKQKLMSNHLIAYLFGEEESGKLNFILSQNSQVIIWVVQGVSAIVARSVKEDNFGIIQHDIKAILKSFIKLKSVLDKAGAINTIAKDRNLYAVKAALRRSLYRIVTEFSSFFDDMMLDPEDIRALQTFVSFKEL
ncbi:hypothetical protein PVAND_000793 [Polypedilum vanderplanki]|uniref:Nucleoporin NDC1 n=1 Tax=Polypedilum vanderplanki TaxID=319348 RepID=A0A9J6BLE5_POLVA|nr:hypothetical protein PVAND_000793 [Polypedilum vanderplanki]